MSNPYGYEDVDGDECPDLDGMEEGAFERFEQMARDDDDIMFLLDQEYFDPHVLWKAKELGDDYLIDALWEVFEILEIWNAEELYLDPKNCLLAHHELCNKSKENV